MYTFERDPIIGSLVKKDGRVVPIGGLLLNSRETRKFVRDANAALKGGCPAVAVRNVREKRVWRVNVQNPWDAAYGIRLVHGANVTGWLQIVMEEIIGEGDAE